MDSAILDTSLEDASGLDDFSGPDEQQTCQICMEKYKIPRILSCLHEFCEACLDNLLHAEDEGDDKLNTTPKLLIKCPLCNQETKVSSEGACGLPIDPVMNSLVEEATVDEMQIICTSCKARKNAVAHCSDCVTFLCLSCVNAHQNMVCFENHKVMTFEEMKSSEDGSAISKPVACNIHSGGILNFFCHTCQQPTCKECLTTDHKPPDHQFGLIKDIQELEKKELETLMTESKNKGEYCEEATQVLNTLLGELQAQHDDAKSSIEETFQTYKAILEKRKEAILDELKEVHSTQELHLMDVFHSVEKTADKIDSACKFTERLLGSNNAIAILSLKKLVGAQLMNLINNMPKPDVTVSLKYSSDNKEFEEAVKKAFRGMKQEEPSEPVQVSPMHSSFESDVFAVAAGVLSPGASSSISPELVTEPLQGFSVAQLASILQHNDTRGNQNSMDFEDFMYPARNSLSSVSHMNVNALNNISALAQLNSVDNGMLSDAMLLNGHSNLTLDTLNLRGRPSPPPTPKFGSMMGRSMQSSPLDPSVNSLLSTRVTSPMSPHSSLMNGGSPTPIMNGAMSALANPFMPTGFTGMGSHQSFFSSRSTNGKLNSMQIRYKFGNLGPGKGQFNSPHGFCMGIEEEIIVADTNNHRIQIFEKTGEFKYQFGIPGKEEGQLWYPRKVAVIRPAGKFVVCDRGNERSRMQIFSRTGHFIKKIAIRYIDIVAGLAVTPEGYIVAVDSVSPTVFIVHENGDLLRWFDCSEYMREPSDLAVSGRELFVCDFKGHCVVVFNEEGTFLRRIGYENMTNFPNGIDVSDAGDVLIGDSHGNRFHVAVFNREGTMFTEFECPSVKVSRCCGLKITSEGYVVTLAKNNHHVLVLNTLYIQ